MAEETTVLDTTVEEKTEDTVLTQPDETTETKEEVATSPEEGAEKPEDTPGEDKASAGAPEKYEDFEMPEGFVKDEEMLDNFAKLAKEANLPQDKAQEFFNLGTKMAEEIGNANVKAWEDLSKSWLSTAKSDKEFGGTRWDESLGVAKKAISEFGDSDFVDMLNYTGVGNHPAMIRSLWKIGKAISEDRMHVGGQPGGAPKSLAERIYGTNN